MIKLKKILKESKYAWDRQFGDPLPTFKDVVETHQNKSKEQINERISKPFIVHPEDPDQTERHWVKVFKELAKGHGSIIDYGPRESAQYDWNDQSNYKDAITEYNKYMNKIADKLNKSLDEMNGIYKVWTKIRDKYRNKDKKS